MGENTAVQKAIDESIIEVPSTEEDKLNEDIESAHIEKESAIALVKEHSRKVVQGLRRVVVSRAYGKQQNHYFLRRRFIESIERV